MPRKPIFPTPPPSLLGRRDGRGGVQGGGARPAVPGGGGVNPTSMAQNDTHVALIILITQTWRGGKLLVEKKFSGQILCSCALGANIRSYTKQRARHGTPFLQPPPPPPPSAGVHVTPPPAEQFSGCFQVALVGCIQKALEKGYSKRPRFACFTDEMFEIFVRFGRCLCCLLPWFVNRRLPCLHKNSCPVLLLPPKHHKSLWCAKELALGVLSGCR